MSLESYVIDIIEERKKAPCFARILALASQAFHFCVKLRHSLYDRKIFKIHDLGACVVSVGNIVSGGTGKTPLIELLANQLKDGVSIITRGYRSEIERSGKVALVSKGQGPLVSVEQCGDEAFWLASITTASIWVGKDKVESSTQAVESGSKILLIDDGLQHRRLHRDIEIILLDGKDPWGKGAFLPRGYLRDSPSRLKVADLIVVSNIEPGKPWEDLVKKIRVFSGSPVVRVHRSYTIEKGFSFTKVGVFCGISKPHHFIDAVISLGKTIVDNLILPDHMAPSISSLQVFARSCKNRGATAIVCTEKDFVKLPGDLVLEIPIIVLQMRSEIAEGKEDWDACIEKILRKAERFSHSFKEQKNE
ncbi:MAG: tetraacyldisaccharide 4'-kinase [Chlamydiae bacterium]|nr:tetraacyldisaccharide 4'-kinase [Chlamydiota bacterium]